MNVLGFLPRNYVPGVSSTTDDLICECDVATHSRAFLKDAMLIVRYLVSVAKAARDVEFSMDEFINTLNSLFNYMNEVEQLKPYTIGASTQLLIGELP